MSTVVGQIQINLGANTVAFQVEMDRAAALAAKASGNISGTLQKLSSGGFKGVTDGAKSVSKAIGDMGHGAVTDVQAVSASLRTLEGGLTNNLRAAERFAANFLGLGGLAQKLFPIAGGAALLGVVGELGKKAYELYEQFKQMESQPAKIAAGFREINNSLQTSNDELALSNDRIRDQIAKLEGKPSNGLAVALDEARLASDKLSDSLTRNLVQVQKLLQENEVGKLAGLFTGRAETVSIEQSLFGKDGYGGFKKQIDDINDKYSDLLANSKSQSYSASVQAAQKIELETAYGRKISEVNEELKQRQALQAQRDKTSFLGGIVQQGTYGSGRPDDQKAAIASLEGVRRNLQRERIFIQLDVDEAPLKAKLEHLRTQPKSGKDEKTEADPVEKKLSELRAELGALKQEIGAIDASPIQRAFSRGLGDAQKEVAALNEQLKPKGESVPVSRGLEITQTQVAISLEKELLQIRQQQSKQLAALGEEYRNSSDKEQASYIEKLSSIREQISETSALMAAQVGGSSAIRAAELANIDSRVKSGQIAQDEADLLKEKLTNENRLSDVQAAIAGATKDELETLKQQHTILLQIGADKTLIAQNEKQQKDAIDKQTLATGNFRDGVRLAFQDMSKNAKSSAQDAYTYINSAFESINSSITRIITGQKVSWAGFFQSLSSGLAKIGLEKIEGGIAGALGGIFGKKGSGGDPTKPTGAASNPFWVRLLGQGGGTIGTGGATDDSSGDGSDSATAGGSIFSKIGGALGGLGSFLGNIFSKLGGFLGGILGKLGGSFAGFFATGGSIGGGQGAIVGENGPEYFSPSTSGTIIPNNKLSGMGGAGAYYYIDARGTDPVQSDRNFKRALEQVHGSAVQTSAKVAAESARRKP